MPELPEVECLRRSLEPHLLGHTIRSARLIRADILTAVPPDKGKPPSTSTALLEGARITQLVRRGKQLALLGTSAHADPVLVIHLGMSGQILHSAAGEEDQELSHVHAAWELSSGGRLLFRDPRRFGGLWALPSRAALDSRWAALGPDALEIDPESLADALAGSQRTIKAALLDQAVLAGVGNIYADEALFLAKVLPRQRAGALKPAAVERLAKSIREVLQTSIDSGGSTLRDYVDANRRRGSYQASRWVYGRGGEPCLRCGTVLKSALVAQRTTTWCPACQQRKGS